jgi:hypothetical protein
VLQALCGSDPNASCVTQHRALSDGLRNTRPLADKSQETAVNVIALSEYIARARAQADYRYA